MKRMIIALCLLAGYWLTAEAQYDFLLTDASGTTLYYQFLPQCQCVRVTHPLAEWPYYADSKPSGKIVIPDRVEWGGYWYEVEEVGDNAFYGCDDITMVDFGGVFRVGSQAFQGCTRLDSVDFCFTLREIGDGAFANCSSLRVLELPDGLTCIGTSAFSMCKGLERVVLSPETEAACNATTFHGVDLIKEAKKRKIDPHGRIIYSQKGEKVEKILD